MAAEKKKQAPSLSNYILRGAGAGALVGGLAGAGKGVGDTAALLSKAQSPKTSQADASAIYKGMADDVNNSWVTGPLANSAVNAITGLGLDVHERHGLRNAVRSGAVGTAAGAALGSLVALAMYFKNTRTK